MGQTSAIVTMMLAGTLSIFWVIAIAGGFTWHRKSTLIWNFDVGLNHVIVSKSLGGHAAHGVGFLFDKVTGKISGKPSSAAQQAISEISEGEQSLRFYRDAFCSAASVIGDNCSPWDHLLIGSWILTIVVIIGVIMLCVAAIFQWYYWTQEPRRLTRAWAQGLYITAPILLAMGMVVYSLLTVSFSRWLSELQISSRNSTFSYTYVYSWMLLFFTFIPSLINCTFAGVSDMEDGLEDISRQKRELMYGACDPSYGGQANPYGAQPQAQQMYDQYGQPIADPYAGYAQGYGQQQQPYQQQYAQQQGFQQQYAPQYQQQF